MYEYFLGKKLDRSFILCVSLVCVGKACFSSSADLIVCDLLECLFLTLSAFTDIKGKYLE